MSDKQGMPGLELTYVTYEVTLGFNGGDEKRFTTDYLQKSIVEGLDIACPMEVEPYTVCVGPPKVNDKRRRR